MSKPLVFMSRDDYDSIAVNILQEKFQIIQWPRVKSLTKQVFLENVKGVFGILCSPPLIIDQDVLNAAGSTLKVVSTCSVGYDHINVEDLKARGVKIGYTPDVLTEATAEFCVGLLLATSRRIVESYLSIQKNEWNSPVLGYTWMCGQGLENSIVGIVGCGRIGTSVARKIKAFNIKRLLYYSQNKKPEVEELGGELRSIDEVIKESDFVIVTIVQNEQTKGIINKERINSMKSNAILVNCARGGIVNQKALTEALQNKTIAGAGLDVFDPEPIDPNDPLLKLSNVVVTPHIASATYLSRKAMAEVAARNIVAVYENTEMPAEIK